MSFVADSRYHSITISDHCPVQLDMSFPNSSVPQCSWQLDRLLLKQPSFEKCISDQIDFFLLTNSTPGMSYATIWESLKAYLRGQIISYATHKKRERNKRLRELNQQILNIDNQLAHNSTPELFKERLLLQTEFDNLSIRLTERMMLKTRQTYYEHGERAGKLFCHQLKQWHKAQFLKSVFHQTRPLHTHKPLMIVLKHIILNFTDHRHLRMRRTLRIF